MKKLILLLPILLLTNCATKKKTANHSSVSALSSSEWVGTIDHETVRRVIRSSLSTIKKCYDDELKNDATAAGKVVIEFEINDSGAVNYSRIRSATATSGKFLATPECVRSTIQRLRFPDAPAGQVAVVAFPFVFDKVQ